MVSRIPFELDPRVSMKTGFPCVFVYQASRSADYPSLLRIIQSSREIGSWRVRMSALVVGASWFFHTYWNLRVAKKGAFFFLYWILIERNIPLHKKWTKLKRLLLVPIASSCVCSPLAYHMCVTGIVCSGCSVSYWSVPIGTHDAASPPPSFSHTKTVHLL